MIVFNIVQWGSVYKYFTSSFTFFQSSCVIMHIVKISITSFIAQFTSYYNLLDLLLIMLMIDYCLFCSYFDL